MTRFLIVNGGVGMVACVWAVIERFWLERRWLRCSGRPQCRTATARTAARITASPPRSKE